MNKLVFCFMQDETKTSDSVLIPIWLFKYEDNLSGLCEN